MESNISTALIHQETLQEGHNLRDAINSGYPNVCGPHNVKATANTCGNNLQIAKEKVDWGASLCTLTLLDYRTNNSKWYSPTHNWQVWEHPNF